MLINSFDELINWVEKNRGKNFYFRCYENENELLSTLGRESVYVDNEFNIFNEFAVKVIEVLGNMPFFKMLELGQHFGLPTRFIDFTVDPYVALFFGLGKSNHSQFHLCYTNKMNENISLNIKNYQNTLGDIGSLRICDIKKVTIGQLRELRADTMIMPDYLKNPLSKGAYKHFFDTQQNFILVPFDSCEKKNPRIMAQRGLFIAMKAPSEPLSKDLFDEIKISLSDDDVKNLRKLLDNKKYTPEELFVRMIDGFDIENCAEEIKIKYKSA